MTKSFYGILVYMRSKLTSIRNRRVRGFSLVSVVVTASLTSIFLLASAASILPIFKSVGSSIVDVQLSSAAQSATDLTIGLLNSGDSVKAAFDSPSVYGEGTKVNDSFALTAAMFGLPEGATVEVWVWNRAPMKIALDGTGSSRSLAFDPILSPSGDPNLPDELKNSDEKWGLYSGVGFNGWRVIETRVKFGNSQKLLLTTLKPVLIARDKEQQSSSPLFSDSSSVGNARGLNGVWLGNGTITSAVTSLNSGDIATGGGTVAGDVATFGELKLDNGANVGGKAQVQRDAAGNMTGSITSDNTGQVNQYLQADSQFSNLDSSTVHNYGDTNNPDPNLNRYTAGDATDAPSLASGGVAPAPSAPDGINPTSAITETSPNVGGDYVVPSISVQNGTLVTTGPTRVFIEGTNGTNGGSSDPVVNIQGRLNPGKEASDFQIYYNGTGTIVLQGTEINATIYAPNANIQMGSNNQLAFTGSLLARNIAGTYDNGVAKTGVTKTQMRLDYGNRTLTGSPGNGGLSYEISDVQHPKRFKVYSVLEPRNPNDPKYSH